MSTDNEAEVRVGADTGGVDAKIAGMAKSVAQSLGIIDKAFDVTQTLSVAAGTLIAQAMEKMLASIKEVIQRSVSEYNDLGDAVEHMQHRIGGSSEEVSALKVELESVGLSMGQFEAVAMRLPLVIKQHADDFKKAGVAYKDAEGNLLSTKDTIANIMDYLNKFHAGQERNTAGMALMGRSYQQLADFVELTSDRIKEADEVADHFALTLSEKDVEAADAFGRKTALLASAVSGFYVLIGRALTPALTSLAETMRSIAGVAFKVFQGALVTVAFWVEVVINVVSGLTLVFIGVGESIRLVIRLFGALAEAASTPGLALVHAKEAWQDYKNGMKAIGESIVDNFKNSHQRLTDLANPPQLKDGKKDKPSKGITDTDPAGEAALALAEAKAANAIIKELLAERSADLENQRKNELVDLASYYDQKLEIEQAGLRADMELKKQEIAAKAAKAAEGKDLKAVNAALAEKIKLENDLVVLGLKLNASGVKSGQIKADAIRADNKKIQTEMLGHVKKLTDIELDGEMETIRMRKALGIITDAEEIEHQRNLEARRHTAAMTELEEKKQLAGTTIAEKRALDQQIELLEKQHALKMKKTANDLVLAQRAGWLSVFGTMQTSFASAITSMVMQGTKLRQALGSIFNSIAGEFIQKIIAEPLAAMAMSVIRQSALYTWLFGVKKAEEAAAGTTQMALQKVLGVTGVASNAAIAATAAMASVAAIPFYGWAMAPEVGAATYATAMAFMPSAEKGYDIPAGVNPITQLHEKEMVLPEGPAETLRRLEGNSGGMVLNISAIDAKGVRDFFMDNAHNLAPAMKKIQRQFMGTKRS